MAGAEVGVSATGGEKAEAGAGAGADIGVGSVCCCVCVCCVCGACCCACSDWLDRVLLGVVSFDPREMWNLDLMCCSLDDACPMMGVMSR